MATAGSAYPRTLAPGTMADAPSTQPTVSSKGPTRFGTRREPGADAEPGIEQQQRQNRLLTARPPLSLRLCLSPAASACLGCRQRGAVQSLGVSSCLPVQQTPAIPRPSVKLEWTDKPGALEKCLCLTNRMVSNICFFHV